MKKLLLKHREILLYLIFGGLTTAVNFIFYITASWVLGFSAAASSAIAWVFAVLFAFFTNRKLVFRSKTTAKAGVLREFGLFAAARILSGLANIGIMWLFVDHLELNELAFYVIAQIFVIVFNYVASKWFIFR